MAQNDSRDFDGADLVAGFGVEDDDVRVLVTEAAGFLDAMYGRSRTAR